MPGPKEAFEGVCCCIFSKLEQQALEVQDASLENGALVQIGLPTGIENQLWQFVQTSSGFYQLLCKGSNKLLDIVAGNTNNGAWVHQWEGLETPSQLWTIQPTQDGYYKILSKLSGKCLSVVTSSGKDEITIELWEDLNGENQKWKIAPAVQQRIKNKPACKDATIAAQGNITVEKPQISKKKVVVSAPVRSESE